MSGITELGTTFNLPNYTGVLHLLTPAATPFFSAIGGLTNGGGGTADYEFEWQSFDLRQPGQNVKKEGQDAPDPQNRKRSNHSNIVQIHQETVGVSYSKLAASQRLSGINQGGTSNPVTNELDWQVRQMLVQMVRDINWSFINGIYQKPSDNTTERATRGLLDAITTNKLADESATLRTGATSATDTITVTHSLAVGDRVVFTKTGGANLIPGRVYYVKSTSTTASFKVADTKGGTAITVGTGTDIEFYQTGTAGTNGANTKANVNRLARTVWENGSTDDELTTVLLVNNRQKEALTLAYSATYEEASRTVGGVSVSTIVTDYGTFGIMVDRMMPQDAIALVQLSQCKPVYLDIPGKGHFFAEPLAKTGAQEKTMLYGETGLAYGMETSHGVLRGAYIPE